MTFQITKAKRSQVPLLVGLFGPSSSGKTFSALRIATGMQRVRGGRIVMIDTEARRGLHYASDFDFDHMPFTPDFSPLRYLEACQLAVQAGAGVIVIDSASHMHEGPGGILEQHAANVERMSKGDSAKADRVKMTAWIQPKQDFRYFVNSLLQLNVAIVMAFRAKEKIRPVRGGEPEQLGWMPIISEELPYEMTMNALLEPGADGVPTWQPQEPASRGMVKLPKQFRERFGSKRAPLDESDGEYMARWAQGDVGPIFRSGKEWGGKSLAAAPLEVLLTYKNACTEGLAKKRNGEADSLRAHIAEVAAEIESRAASAFSLETPPDDVEARAREAAAL